MKGAYGDSNPVKSCDEFNPNDTFGIESDSHAQCLSFSWNKRRLHQPPRQNVQLASNSAVAKGAKGEKGNQSKASRIRHHHRDGPNPDVG
jgi:hypothetical protein